MPGCTQTFNLAYAYFFNVTVSSVPGGAQLIFDCLLVDVNYQGNGFQITGNSIGNNRGNGVILKAGNGLITSNSIQSPKFWSIQVMLLWSPPCMPGQTDERRHA